MSNVIGSYNAVADSGGTPIANGTGYIAVGYFNISDVAIQTSATVGDLDAAFVQFGASNTFGTGFAVAGLYQHGVTANANAYATQSVFTVIGNGATLAASSEVLVFKHSHQFQVEPNPTSNAQLGQAQPGTLLIGEFGNYSHNQAGAGVSSSYNTVSLVPEPSVALLGLAGGLLMLRRRRC